MRPGDRRRRFDHPRPVEDSQHARDPPNQLTSIDHIVHLPVGQLGLGQAEVGRQLLTGGLLDNPRAGERDQRSRLGEGDVAQRGEGRPDPARGRVSQHHDRRLAGVAQQFEGDHRLGHLHEGDHPLLHSSAARRRHHDQRQPLFGTSLGRPIKLLAHHRAHAAAQVGEVHRRNHAPRAADRQLAHHQRLVVPLAFGALHPVRVGLQVDELQRIRRAQMGPQLLPWPALGQLVDALARTDHEVVPAGAAHAEIAPQFLGPVVAGTARAGAVVGRELARGAAGRATFQAVDGNRDVASGHGLDYGSGAVRAANQRSTPAV